MAKTIQYRVEVNTSRAKDDLNELDNQLDDIQEKSKVDLVIENAGAVKSVGDVRKAYKALRDAQIEVGEGTEEFTRLGQAAAQLKDRLDAVNEVAKDLGGSTLERFRNSIGRIREGIVNLDIDKVRQGFTQLGTTFKGITTGLTGARGAAIAFGTALAATGIAAFIGVIAVLIKNFDTIKESGGLIGNTFKGIGKIVENVTTSTLKLSDALGLTSNAYKLYIDKKNESTEANKKELRSLEELTQAEFDRRKELGLTTAAEEEAERIRRAKIDLDKEIIALEDELVRLNEERNKAQEDSIKLSEEGVQLSKRTSINSNEIITISEAYSKLNAEQKEYIDDLVRIELQNRKNQVTGEEVENQLFKELKFKTQIGVASDLFVDKLVEQALATEKINTLSNEQIDIENRLAKAIELKELAKQKSIDDTLKKDLENAEKIRNIELDRLNRRFLQELETEESLATEKQNIEQRFLSEKLRLNEKAGKDISAIQVQISDNLVAFEKKRIEDLKKFVDDALSQTINVEVAPFTTEERRPQDVKNANEKISLYQKQLDVLKQLNGTLLEGGELEIENLNQSLLFNDQKLDILEEYGLKDSQLYKDAINEKIILEAQLTKAIEDENAKRLEAEKELNRKKLSENLQYSSQILGSFGSLTSSIQALNEQVYANEIAEAEGNFERQEELRKESFEANKALQIAGAVITTAQAVLNGLNAGLQIGGPWGIALGAVTAAAAAATGAVQIATIEATRYQPSGGSNPNITAPTPATPASIQPNVTFAGEGTGLNQAGQGSTNQFNMSASISVSEINNVQNQVAVYESGSLLGGFG